MLNITGLVYHRVNPVEEVRVAMRRLDVILFAPGRRYVTVEVTRIGRDDALDHRARRIRQVTSVDAAEVVLNRFPVVVDDSDVICEDVVGAVREQLDLEQPRRKKRDL